MDLKRNIKYLLTWLILAFVGMGAQAGDLLRFIENKGQWHESVKYRVDGQGVSVFVLQHSIKYLFYEDQHRHEHIHAGGQSQDGSARRGNEDRESRRHAVEVSFLGANRGTVIQPSGVGNERYHYFYGSDRKSWATDVRAYDRLSIKNIYKGIDLLLYSEDGTLKYDWKLSENADPGSILLEYAGQDELAIKDNQLMIRTSLGTIVEGVPLTYQMVNGRKSAVTCEYKLTSNRVRFDVVDSYERSEPLVIDPKLIFSTYSGSVSDNWGYTATFDDEGNLYSGGIVAGQLFPVTNGALQENWGGFWDVAILKYDSLGENLHYATFLGGNSSEVPASIIVNSAGELLVYGTTSSTNFPVTDNAFQKVFAGGSPLDAIATTLPQLVGGVPYHNGSDLYVARISSNGDSLLSSSYIGGTANDGVILTRQVLTKNYGDHFRGEIFSDEENNVYVASTSSSPDFPVINAFQSDYGGGANDGVVFKLNPDLSNLEWSSFLGGSGMDAVYSIRVDRDHNVFVGGGTNSTDYPTTAGTIKPVKPNPADIDGVISLIGQNGDSLIASSYIGTDAYDQVYLIDLDSAENIYLLGQTQGNYPVSPDVYSNANSGQFIHKLGHHLDTTYFSTVFGSGRGSPDIRPTAFLVNECENMLISGWGGNVNSTINYYNLATGFVGGNTNGLPVTNNAFQNRTDGSDFYLMVLLNDAKRLLYGTYFGEYGGRGEHVDGGTSRFDKRGIIYHAVCASCTGTDGFPTTPGVWSSTNNSSNCNNAAFKFDLASLIARFDTDTPEFDNPGIRSGCYPLTLVFLNKSIGGEAYEWTFGEGTRTNQPDSITITYQDPGSYPVTLIATDINTCVRESVARGTITVFDYNFKIMADDSICFGDAIQLSASGGVDYRWEPDYRLSDPNTANPVARPDTTIIYKVKVVDANQCNFEDSVRISVVPAITTDFDIERTYDCISSPVFQFINKSENASAFIWDFGDGNTTTEINPVYKYAEGDTLQSYLVWLAAKSAFCVQEKQEEVISGAPFIPNFISPNGDQKNDEFKVITDKEVKLRIYNRWGKLLYENEAYQNDWSGEGLAPAVYYYEVTLPDESTTCKGWVHLLR